MALAIPLLCQSFQDVRLQSQQGLVDTITEAACNPPSH